MGDLTRRGHRLGHFKGTRKKSYLGPPFDFFNGTWVRFEDRPPRFRYRAATDEQGDQGGGREKCTGRLPMKKRAYKGYGKVAQTAREAK